jgi:PmbA protein
MLSVEEARSRVEQLVEQAKRAGADGADSLYLGERSSGIQVRKSELEDVHRSEGENIGLRVFRGSKSASVSSSDLSAEALAALVTRALAMAAEAPDDPYAGLAASELLASPPFPDLDGWDDVEPNPRL